jgi:hypothetical protein
MESTGLTCNHCYDLSDVVTPFNGRTLLANTPRGELIVALHWRCEVAWTSEHACRTLVPLRRIRRWQASRCSSEPAVH